MEYSQFERRATALGDALRSSPRFGRTDDFSDLFDPDKSSEYIGGVLVASVILVCFFLCWAIVLLVLMCMGKRRVGFLSGAPYQMHLVADNTDINPRIKRGRIVFGIFGLLFITFTFLLLFLGIANLSETTTELSNGAKLGSEMFADFRTLLSQFIEGAEAASKARDAAVETLQEVFDTYPLDGSNIILPNNITINATLPPDQVANAKYVINNIDFRDRASQVLVKLYQLEDMIDNQTAELYGVIDDGQAKCNNVYDGLSDMELKTLQLAYGIPYTVFPFLMLVLMVLTAMGVNNSGKDFCTSLCFVPFFAVLVALLVIFTGGFAVGGIMNADFCSGGEDSTPDATVVEIMEINGVDPASLKYRAIQYLINDCSFDTPTSEYPLEFMVDFKKKLQGTDISLDNFTAAVDDVGVESLKKILGNNITRVTEVVDDIMTATNNLLDIVVLALKQITCERLSEIYTTVIDTAVCYNSYYGLVWCFSAFLVMSFCGMMMITFRAVLYYPTGEMDDFSWNEVKAREGEGIKENTADENIGPSAYVQDEGIRGSSIIPTEPSEAPMGGQLRQSYESVGDDNPFADTANTETFEPQKSTNTETFQPQKSSWE